MLKSDIKALRSGDYILGKYKILKLLGKGRFSFVYLVEKNGKTGSHFVVKEFFPHDFVERKKNNEVFLKNRLTPWKIDEFNSLKEIFQKEANNLKKITSSTHLGVPSFISYHENINNTAYLVTSYTEITSFENYIQQLNSPELIVKLLREILLILEHIHSYNIYHQDIKYENILIKKDSTPLIIDFGASVILYDKKTGKYLNTASPETAAIEQLSLSYPPEINESTDVYSVAALIYRILTGRYPVNAKEREEAIEKGKPDPYISLNSKKYSCFHKNILISIDKALSLYPEDRYSNAKEFRLALNKNKTWHQIKNFLFIY